MFAVNCSFERKLVGANAMNPRMLKGKVKDRKDKNLVATSQTHRDYEVFERSLVEDTPHLTSPSLSLDPPSTAPPQTRPFEAH